MRSHFYDDFLYVEYLNINKKILKLGNSDGVFSIECLNLV